MVDKYHINPRMIIELAGVLREHTYTLVKPNGDSENTFDTTTASFSDEGRFLAVSTIIDDEVFGALSDLTPFVFDENGAQPITDSQLTKFEEKLKSVIENLK